MAAGNTFYGFVLVILIIGCGLSQSRAQSLDGSALAEISGSVAGNIASASGTLQRTNTIEGGFESALGASVVQQNNGSNNAISAAFSVSGNGGFGAQNILP